MPIKDFDAKLQRYAMLLAVRGLNVRPGQHVQVLFQAEAQRLAELVATAAYKLGAAHVDLIYDSVCGKWAQLRYGQYDRFHIPAYVRVRTDDIVDKEGCVLNLRTNPEPERLAEVGADAVRWDREMRTQRARYFDEGINQGKVAWCVAYPPSRNAAVLAYPELPSSKALEAFWDAVFRITMCDTSDYLARWEALDAKLRSRTIALTALGIRQLHFEGPGTRLNVGLSPQALWNGGSKKTAAGKPFTANVPSYEVFTTPDWPMVSGEVRVTRPVNVNGVLVENLTLVFEKGVVSKFDCTRGRDAVASLLKQDDGAKRLGEVALVGTDSPIAKENRVFYETLYDENAACHVALGDGYANCIRGGWGMNRKQLDAARCNDSKVHQDVMISSAEVDVTAYTLAGEAVPLLRKGQWVDRFA
jgi:aminopeptidase